MDLSSEVLTALLGFASSFLPSSSPSPPCEVVLCLGFWCSQFAERGLVQIVLGWSQLPISKTASLMGFKGNIGVVEKSTCVRCYPYRINALK